MTIRRIAFIRHRAETVIEKLEDPKLFVHPDIDVYDRLVDEPKSEEDVKFLFFRCMEKLGVIAVIDIQTYFPDATVVVLDGGNLKVKFVEFEYDAQTFIDHGHLKQMGELDIRPEEVWIVCWKNSGLSAHFFFKELRQMWEEKEIENFMKGEVPRKIETLSRIEVIELRKILTPTIGLKELRKIITRLSKEE